MALRVGSFSRVPASIPAFWRTLHPRPTHGFLLGSGSGGPGDRYVYLSLEEPRRVVSAPAARSLAALRTLERKLDRGGFDVFPRLVGFIGFDAGRGFDAALARLPRMPDATGLPAVLFGDYAAIARIDLAERRTDVVTRGSEAFARAVRRRVERALATDAPMPAGRPTTRSRMRVASPAAFARAVNAAKRHIAAGDIYQANLSLLFQRPFAGDPLALYERLSRRNPSPYAALMKCGDAWLVSCSPELLIQVDGKRLITRPIAGTRPRGRDAAHDRRRRGQLLLSPKERAEHIMLVDLERNDLGRVCAPGSVTVTEKFAVERYSHVMHIVSQVEGKLAPGRTAVDAVAAVFPGGTITGCPKIRSVEIIQALERASRSVFYGSAGYFCGNADAKFNILIRTALIRRGRLSLRAGAGIVADSRADREYREVLAKARAIVEAAEG